MTVAICLLVLSGVMFVIGAWGFADPGAWPAVPAGIGGFAILAYIPTGLLGLILLVVALLHQRRERPR